MYTEIEKEGDGLDLFLELSCPGMAERILNNLLLIILLEIGISVIRGILIFRDASVSRIVFRNWPRRLTLKRSFHSQPFDREQGPHSRRT